MRKLTTEQRAQILTALVEGNSIASTCRMFGVNKITVLRLLADAGTLAADYHDLTVRELSTKLVQVDELWSFVGARNRNVQPKNWGKGQGDNWTWISIDADSKLAINWITGGRDASYGYEFVSDLADRLADRIQLTSDGYAVYRDVVNRAFGTKVDYAQLMKSYAKPQQNHTRYSPPVCVGCERLRITGRPKRQLVSTSFIERQNLTLRMGNRRFTRLTNAFSKSRQNHLHAIALHFFNYNFIRKHQTIKTTPAVMAGIADREWTMIEFVQMLEREEKLLGGKRLTNYKPAKSKNSGN